MEALEMQHLLMARSADAWQTKLEGNFAAVYNNYYILGGAPC